MKELLNFPIVKNIGDITQMSENFIGVKPTINNSDDEKFFIEPKYGKDPNDPNDVDFDFTVTEENLELVTKWFNFKNKGIQTEVKIGDLVKPWKIGGALSMRKGLTLYHDEIEIKTILTAMS